MYFHDEEERRRWQNPAVLLAEIGLKPDFTFIDIGCGEGFFILPAAKLVGSEGRVFGVDVDSEVIRRLKEKAAKEDLRNLTLTVGKAEETVFCESCADLVFFGIVLHDFEDPAKVLTNAKKMLKSSGRLINLDWKKKPMKFGPPFRIRFSEEEAMHLIEAAGFFVEAIKEAGPYHYIIVAKP